MREFDLVWALVQAVDDEVDTAEVLVGHLFQQRSECFQFQRFTRILVVQALGRSRNFVRLNNKLTHKRTKDPGWLKSVLIRKVAVVKRYYFMCGQATKVSNKT